MDGIEFICHNLERSFDEQGDDPVSLVTIIDIYGSEINKAGNQDNIEIYLEKLLELLKKHHNVVYEIGWDLPKFLLTFINVANINIHKKLIESRIFSLVSKCFNEVALSGNPKECLLTSCELLADLNFADDENLEFISDDDEDKEKNSYVNRNNEEFIPDLKLHIIFELLISCTQRIETLNPSSFLSTVISSITKFLRININGLENTEFILQRIIELCINYKPIFLSKSKLNDNTITNEKYEKIVNDETVLSNKLLRQFLTYSLAMCFKQKELYFDLTYFNCLNSKKNIDNIFDPNLLKISSRLSLLIDLFDIDLEQAVLQCFKESREIYEDFITNNDQTKNEKSESIDQMVFELSYAYSLKKALNETSLSLDPYGVMILSGFKFLQEKKPSRTLVSIQEAVYLFLRCSTSSLYSELYNNKAMESVSRFWLWVILTRTPISQLKADFEKLSEFIVNPFLQMLLIKSCAYPDKKNMEANFTLLTRILCLIPEEATFSFIQETLLSCPHIVARVKIIGILKNLMMKNANLVSQDPSSENLQSSMSKLVINESLPPPLPPRPYVAINEDRMAVIHSLSMISLQNIKFKATNQMDLVLLLSYMNFFVSLRTKWNIRLLELFSEEVGTQFGADREETIPEIGFIKMANEDLKSFVNEKRDT